jgi:hypothetical protein
MLLAGVAVFPSCRKYEDGPAISFRTKKARLVNAWKAEQVLASGTDITGQYNELTFTFNRDGSYSQTVHVVSQNPVTTNGSWEFKSSKEEIFLSYNQGGSNYITILKLKHKEFWFRDGGNEYHFVPK